MLYVKNLSPLHRALRVTSTLLLAGCTWYYWPSTLGIIFAVSALTMGVTGVFGYCPICKIASDKQ